MDIETLKSSIKHLKQELDRSKQRESDLEKKLAEKQEHVLLLEKEINDIPKPSID